MSQIINQLSAGFYKVKVTPNLGYSIPGYYRKRYAKGIIADLYLRAIAFSDGEKKAILFSCDAIGVHTEAALQIRRMIAEKCELDLDSVYICCVHSHTSFRIDPPSNDGSDHDLFMKWLQLQFVDCAQYAFRDLKPCSIKTAVGEVDDVGFVRIYRMKDGSCGTNPGIGNPDAVSFFGEQDKSLRLIRILREGGKEILLVNFSTHADVITTSTFSPDWPGYLSDDLQNAFAGEVEAVTLVGCEGNSNHVNVFNTKDTLQRTDPYARRMARKLAGEVLRIYDDAEDVEGSGISYCRIPVELGQNPYDPADLPLAEEIYDLYQKVTDQSDPIFEQYRMSVPEACRIMRLQDRPEFTDVPLTGLRIGGVNFIGIPGEPFCSIGMDIKNASADKVVITTCLTNGNEGYFPDAAAFAEDGYERESSVFEHACGKKLSDAGIEAIKIMNP